MPVFPAGFSERVFEFGFNSEYADQNRAVLAAAPHIPTQNEEKTLGYDIAFEIKRRGGVVHSLALQHKTCRFVDAAAASNHRFWNAAGGPYFAFKIDVDQFNAIETIASSGLSGVQFVYCAPMFSKRSEMDVHYLANSVMTRSIWINPKGLGPITDTDTHSMIFSKGGTKAFLLSREPRRLTITPPRHREGSATERRIELQPLYETVYGAVSAAIRHRQPGRREREASEFRMPNEMPPFVKSREDDELIKPLSRLFSEYLGVSWLVEVAQ